jgi:hypothetical protein
MNGCPWWRAWWHRRLRRADRLAVWPALRLTAAHFHSDDEEAAVVEALRAWAVFLQGVGQEHWRCACAADDPVETGGGSATPADG